MTCTSLTPISCAPNYMLGTSPHSRSSAEVCWCGGTDLSPTRHADYLTCRACGTSKLRAALVTGQNEVTEEQTHLYGERYGATTCWCTATRRSATVRG